MAPRDPRDPATRPTLGPAGPTPGHPSYGPSGSARPGPARPEPSLPGPARPTEASNPARRALSESVPGMGSGPARLPRSAAAGRWVELIVRTGSRTASWTGSRTGSRTATVAAIAGRAAVRIRAIRAAQGELDSAAVPRRPAPGPCACQGTPPTRGRGKGLRGAHGPLRTRGGIERTLSGCLSESWPRPALVRRRMTDINPRGQPVR